MEPRFGVLTAAQAAKLLQFDRSKMYRLLEEGQVPFARKLNGSWRIPSTSLYRLFSEPWPKESGGDSTPAADRTTR